MAFQINDRVRIVKPLVLNNSSDVIPMGSLGIIRQIYPTRLGNNVVEIISVSAAPRILVGDDYLELYIEQVLINDEVYDDAVYRWLSGELKQ